MKTHVALVAATALAALLRVSTTGVQADAVTDWTIQLGAAQKASGANAALHAHHGAVVHAVMFDAANGLAKKYSPYFVDDDDAPAGADQSAAVVQAAYTTLCALFTGQPQRDAFDAQLAASLAGLSGSPQAIANGRAWGELVAQRILEWRATDGFANAFSYLGGTQVGVWRTPAAGLSGVNVQFATMEPFTMKQPYQYRPDAPFGSVDRLTALMGAAYAADVNEVKAYGGTTSAVRTPLQADIARFWVSADIADQTTAIRSLLPASYQLVDTARLLALCSMAACDAAIATFDAKYAYALWRPIDAIRLADTDNNPATEVDAAWTPLGATPRHPEFPSGHAVVSAALLGTAALILGDEHTFTLSTAGFPGMTRTYGSFSEAVEEVGNARIWIGFHFRTACDAGRDTGYEIANHAVKHHLRPRHRGWCDRHGRWHGDPGMRD